MAVGQALARGIQMGESRRRGNELNLEQIIASLPGTRGWTRTRRSPAIIRSNAAEMALNERKLDLMDREQALEERKQAVAEEMIQQDRLNAQRQRQEEYVHGVGGRALGVQGRAQAAGDRAQIAADRAYQSGITSAVTGRVERKTAQMEDYNLAKAGLGSGNAAPVLQYFEQYGSSNMRIEDIRFGRGPHDPVQVTFSNAPDQPTTFSNPGEAMMMLLAPTNPELGGAPARKEEREERKVVAKETEVKIKGTAGKELTAQQRAELMRKISTDVDKQMEESTAATAGYETNEQWRNALIEQKTHEVFGAQGVPTREQAPAAQEGAPQYQEIPIRHKDTGEVGTRRIYPDGTQEILDSKGNLIERRAAEGRRYTPPTETRGEVHAIPIKREEPAKGVPERPAQAQRSKAVVYRTDAEGNKVESRVNAQGEVETRIVETKQERDEKKKKKKRSKKRRKD